MPLRPGQDKKTCFIFQHGWGFNSSVWDTWQNFNYATPCQYLDRGYWGKPVIPAFDERYRNVLITHSLGLQFCTPWLAQIDCLVIISGFEHFHGSSKLAGRFTRKHLQRMMSRLDGDVTGLLEDFYRDCEFPHPPPLGTDIDLSLLRSDLHLLDTGYAAIQEIRQVPEILILHGANDRIVASDRARELHHKLPSTIKIIPHAGHGLPFTHANVCLQVINNLLQSSNPAVR